LIKKHSIHSHKISRADDSVRANVSGVLSPHAYNAV